MLFRSSAIIDLELQFSCLQARQASNEPKLIPMPAFDPLARHIRCMSEVRGAARQNAGIGIILDFSEPSCAHNTQLYSLFLVASGESLKRYEFIL